MKNLNYTLSTDKRGILSPEEVYFFYYDIMRDTENNIQSIYDWNNDIQEYLDRKGIIIDVMEKESLPENFEKDKLYFTMNKNKDNKAVVFFRHLRNAFVHFRIVHEAEYLNIEDGCQKTSMIGQIKYEDLKELCFLFFKQGDKFIEENNI